MSLPLFPEEKEARDHAILCTSGFLILLPLGVLVARYLRNFVNQWWFAHAAIQLIISGPVILVGWAKGHFTANMLQNGHYNDTHKKIGLTLLILYLIQLFGGMFIHFVKFPSWLSGHRPPQNYFHAILGLVILALAAYQVHYGLVTEWLLTGNLHPVPKSAIHAWESLIIVFWVLYAVGLAFLPRQFHREKEARKSQKDDQIALKGSGD